MDDSKIDKGKAAEDGKNDSVVEDVPEVPQALYHMYSISNLADFARHRVERTSSLSVACVC